MEVHSVCLNERVNDHVYETLISELTSRMSRDEHSYMMLVKAIGSIAELPKLAFLSEKSIDDLYSEFESGSVVDSDFIMNILINITLSIHTYANDIVSDGYNILLERIKSGYGTIIESPSLPEGLSERMSLKNLDDPVVVTIYFINCTGLALLSSIESSSADGSGY